MVKVERVPGTGPHADEPNSKDSPRSQWLVYTSASDQPDGPFDAVVCTIGTCGDPIRVGFEGTEEFERAGGRVVHSSELDQLGTGDDDSEEEPKDKKDNGKSETSGEGPDISLDNLTEAQPETGVSYADKVKTSVDSDDEQPEEKVEEKDSTSPKPLNVRGKTVAIIGSGASAIEAAEWAVEKGVGKILILARLVLHFLPSGPASGDFSIAISFAETTSGLFLGT